MFETGNVFTFAEDASRADRIAARKYSCRYDGTRFLEGGGEMGERIRRYNWSGTPIGPMESWSPALRMMLSILLANRFPLLLCDLRMIELKKEINELREQQGSAAPYPLEFEPDGKQTDA